MFGNIAHRRDPGTKIETQIPNKTMFELVMFVWAAYLRQLFTAFYRYRVYMWLVY